MAPSAPAAMQRSISRAAPAGSWIAAEAIHQNRSAWSSHSRARLSFSNPCQARPFSGGRK